MFIHFSLLISVWAAQARAISGSEDWMRRFDANTYSLRVTGIYFVFEWPFKDFTHTIFHYISDCLRTLGYKIPSYMSMPAAVRVGGVLWSILGPIFCLKVAKVPGLHGHSLWCVSLWRLHWLDRRVRQSIGRRSSIWPESQLQLSWPCSSIQTGTRWQ